MLLMDRGNVAAGMPTVFILASFPSEKDLSFQRLTLLFFKIATLSALLILNVVSVKGLNSLFSFLLLKKCVRDSYVTAEQ